MAFHFRNDWKSKLGQIALMIAVLPYRAAILIRRFGRWLYRGLGPLACAVLHRGYHREIGQDDVAEDGKVTRYYFCLFCRREWTREFRG